MLGNGFVRRTCFACCVFVRVKLFCLDFSHVLSRIHCRIWDDSYVLEELDPSSKAERIDRQDHEEFHYQIMQTLVTTLSIKAWTETEKSYTIPGSSYSNINMNLG